MSFRQSRRAFLRWVGLAGAAALLEACAPCAELSRTSEIGRTQAPDPANALADQSAPLVVQAADGLATLPPLNAQLFGSFLLERGGQVGTGSELRVGRTHQLAALLILNKRGLPAETLARLLSPRVELLRARHYLQMTTYMLRDELGSKAAVRYDQGSYRLHRRLQVVADVREFDTALRQARGAARADQVVLLTRALKLYREPLLADVKWEWAAPVRRLYHQRYTSAARTLASL